MLAFLLSLAVGTLAGTARAAAVPPSPAEIVDVEEPIPFLQRYKPSYFLLGEPNTKVHISLKIQTVRDFPLYFGFSQLLIWDLFKESAPIRDMNFNPEVFYRLELENGAESRRQLDVGIYEHESNGEPRATNRSWDRAYLRYTSTVRLATEGYWWSFKAQLPYGMGDEASRRIPQRRGLWEAQVGVSDLFGRIFEVNELVLRLYGGGRSRINPLQGGQELTWREKTARRKFLLPLYLQIFHGYGENMLDQDDRRWGFRAGVGF